MTKITYFLVLSLVCIACQTLIKDAPEIEKVLEDGIEEIIKDLDG